MFENAIEVKRDSCDGCVVSASIRQGDESRNVYFRSDDLRLELTAESLLSMALVPAMKSGSRLVIEGSVSDQLYSALPTIQDIYATWYKSLRRIQVTGITPESRAAVHSGRTGAFFSGGLDAYYTFLKHQSEITDLVFIHNFDRQVEDPELLKRKSDAVREVGAHFKKNVVEVETNLRSFLDRYVEWGPIGHGPMLVTIGHLLANHLDRVYIAASRTYENLSPAAIHPLLDPLWSTETLKFVHDGCEADRVAKAALIGQSEMALRTLRVCFMHHGGAYNCGRCEKCIRTMLNLEAVGALDQCSTFNVSLDPKFVRKTSVNTASKLRMMAHNLEALERQSGNEELTKALRYVMRRSPAATGLKGQLNRMRHNWSAAVKSTRRALRARLRAN